MLGRMRRYLGIGAAWLAATVLSVVIASAAVAGIRDRVVDTPVAIGAPTTTTTVLSGNDITTTVPDPTTTTTVAVTATSEPPPATTTTVAQSGVTTTTAPQATTTTTTTTTTVPPTTTTVPVTNQTFSLIGGTVTLSVGNGEVWVVSAVANAGFDTDIEHAGPKEAEVKFESNNHKSELSAKFENGELKVEKEEEPRDGDDD